jgi:hypothetical protein
VLVGGGGGAVIPLVVAEGALVMAVAMGCVPSGQTRGGIT